MPRDIFLPLPGLVSPVGWGKNRERKETVVSALSDWHCSLSEVSMSYHVKISSAGSLMGSRCEFYGGACSVFPLHCCLILDIWLQATSSLSLGSTPESVAVGGPLAQWASLIWVNSRKAK